MRYAEWGDVLTTPLCWPLIITDSQFRHAEGPVPVHQRKSAQAESASSRSLLLLCFALPIPVASIRQGSATVQCLAVRRRKHGNDRAEPVKQCRLQYCRCCRKAYPSRRRSAHQAQAEFVLASTYEPRPPRTPPAPTAQSRRLLLVRSGKLLRVGRKLHCSGLIPCPVSQPNQNVRTEDRSPAEQLSAQSTFPAIHSRS